jgi:hypothetical protein
MAKFQTHLWLNTSDHSFTTISTYFMIVLTCLFCDIEFCLILWALMPLDLSIIEIYFFNIRTNKNSSKPMMFLVANFHHFANKNLKMNILSLIVFTIMANFHNFPFKKILPKKRKFLFLKLQKNSLQLPTI